MTADISALIVAVVGVTGTLTAPLLSHWAADRSRRYESGVERDVRAEERQTAAARVAFEEKREIYTELNAQARRTRILYKDCVRRSRHGSADPGPDVRAADEARTRFLDTYNKAQMILPDQVLALASRVNLLLGRGYGMLRDLVESDSRTADELNVFYDGELYEAVSSMRQSMREELGVADASSERSNQAR